jgi:hypothetical protein
MITRSLLLIGLLITCGLQAESKEGPKPAATKLRFMSYDVDRKNPKKITVSISVSTKDRTYFVEVGDPIPGTTFQVQTFEKKTRPRIDRTGDEDLSELTLINVETKEVTVLTIGHITDTPAAN